MLLLSLSVPVCLLFNVSFVSNTAFSMFVVVLFFVSGVGLDMPVARSCLSALALLSSSAQAVEWSIGGFARQDSVPATRLPSPFTASLEVSTEVSEDALFSSEPSIINSSISYVNSTNIPYVDSYTLCQLDLALGEPQSIRSFGQWSLLISALRLCGNSSGYLLCSVCLETSDGAG